MNYCRISFYRSHNLEVPGSSPGWSTLEIKHLREIAGAFSFIRRPSGDLLEAKVTSRDLLKRRVIICEFMKCFCKDDSENKQVNRTNIFVKSEGQKTCFMSWREKVC